MGGAGGPEGTDPLGGGAHDLRGQLGIGPQVADHHLHGDAVVIGVPAVVVGGHGEGGVGDLRLTGQASFGVIGHADHRAAPAAVEIRFGPRGEGRPLHAQIGAATVQCPPGWHQAVGHIRQQAAQPGAEGIRQGHMGHSPLTEKAQRALVGAVDELIGHHHVERAHRLLQGADGRRGEDPTHPQRAHGPDVGAVGHLRGQIGVMAAVPGQEDHLHAPQAAEPQAVGRWAEGCIQLQFLDVLQPLHGIEAAAAEHAKPCPAEIHPTAARHRIVVAATLLPERPY